MNFIPNLPETSVEKYSIYPELLAYVFCVLSESEPLKVKFYLFSERFFLIEKLLFFAVSF